MTPGSSELSAAEDIVRRAAELAGTLATSSGIDIVGRSLGGRETTFRADLTLHDFITSELADLGLPVLSEEGDRSDNEPPPRYWVLDPLDGSVNFARGSGPSAVSLALWEGAEPVWGVVSRIDNGDTFTGGRGVPSSVNGVPIHVSDVFDRGHATIATGLPARFRMDDPQMTGALLSDITGFAKVRMIGAASVSLCLVAQGAVELYRERNIMRWDVGAGLAIVQGAGGEFAVEGSGPGPLTVTASNGLVDHPAATQNGGGRERPERR